MSNFEQLSNEYKILETYRKYRNKWVAAGVGGAAIGGTVAVATGNYGIGALIAIGSALGAESMVLDANMAVRETRDSISSKIGYAREDTVQTEVSLNMPLLQRLPSDPV